MSTAEHDRLVDHMVRTLETMTSMQSAHRLTQFVAKDVTFRDPRLSTQGPDGLTAAMTSLFDRTSGITFRVTDRAWGQDGQTVYLRWDRLLKCEGEHKHAYSGVSEIMIGLDGKIVSIIDHWDAQDHKLPKPRLLGRLFQR